MVYSSGCFRMLMPALLTRMSSRPNALTAAPTSVRHDSPGVPSGTMRATLAPPSRSSAAAVSHFSLLRPTMTTVAPAAPSPRAMPRPMPPLPPVTIATLPVRSKSSMRLLPRRGLVMRVLADRLVAAIRERWGAMFAPDLLNDRVVLVTGGGTGLGKAMGRRFMALGAELMICGRREGVLAEAAQEFAAAFGRKVRTHPVDIRNPEAVEEMMDAAFKDRPLDILVNNAAANFVARTETLSMRAVDSVLNITLHGTAYCTLAAGPRWIERRHARTALSIVTRAPLHRPPYAPPPALAQTGGPAPQRPPPLRWGP